MNEARRHPGSFLLLHLPKGAGADPRRRPRGSMERETVRTP